MSRRIARKVWEHYGGSEVDAFSVKEHESSVIRVEHYMTGIFDCGESSQ